MKIKLQHNEDLGDWYTIVRPHHEGKEWWESVGPDTLRFMSSERLSPEACIEGPASHMIGLANAILYRGSVSYKRCAVSFQNDGVHFHSPKNSKHHAVVSIEEADELAAQILAELTNYRYQGATLLET